MTWRQVLFTILFAPILLGLIMFIALHVVLKLPMFCCERFRAVRWLPYAGLGYYGLVVPLTLFVFVSPWWQIAIATGIVALAGSWLLPDPFTYLLSPRKRRAVKIAIEHVEAQEGPSPIYGMVNIIGSEPHRTLVSVALRSETKPPARRFFAVADKAIGVEELDLEYVSTNHGVHIWC